jgi:regulator of RNase E activity RraA
VNSFVSRLATLHTAVVSDALDQLGVRAQTMAPGLHAVGIPTAVAGRAATLEVVAVDTVPAEPYVVQFQAVDALQAGEVMVVAAPEVASAFWGELITERAKARGCTGVVVDGYCRDIQRIRTGEFAVWARGVHPADSAGRLDAVRYGVPVVCAGVRVEPGDYLLGDDDGVVVVPEGLIEEVLALAEDKARTEDAVRDVLRSGAGIADTYAKYGVM